VQQVLDGRPLPSLQLSSCAPRARSIGRNSEVAFAHVDLVLLAQTDRAEQSHHLRQTGYLPTQVRIHLCIDSLLPTMGVREKSYMPYAWAVMRLCASSLRLVRCCPFSGERTEEEDSLGSLMEVREGRLLFII
jgi:hypothetical protein